MLRPGRQAMRGASIQKRLASVHTLHRGSRSVGTYCDPWAVFPAPHIWTDNRENRHVAGNIRPPGAISLNDRDNSRGPSMAMRLRTLIIVIRT